MIRWLALALLLPLAALGQSREVRPGELSLEVQVEPGKAVPLTGEMVLITIRGTYRRHVTRETLRQPDLAGFSWAQLGPDHWTEARINGQKVKVFTRRMALYPDRAGTLEIGPFTHALTLTDEGDDWFDYEVHSAPLRIEVAPAPATEGWWFPVRRLEISDQWSNPPDQLAPGQGVLRIIRVDALGVVPEMLPPMPELRSPSAMIFAHPEKRLVELTAQGPVSRAFWRWTIRPGNDVSGIVEPITFSYFDTVVREAREVTISAQRVAYAALDAPEDSATVPPPEARLPGLGAAIAAVVVFVGGISLITRNRRLRVGEALRRWPLFDPLARALRRAARGGEAAQVRRIARRILRRDGAKPEKTALVADLDRALFQPGANSPDLPAFARAFLRA